MLAPKKKVGKIISSTKSHVVLTPGSSLEVKFFRLKIPVNPKAVRANKIGIIFSWPVLKHK